MTPCRSLFALVVLCLGLAAGQPVGLAQEQQRDFQPEIALAQLRRERGSIKARTDAGTRAIRFLSGNLGRGSSTSAESTARAFFARRAALFGLQAPNAELFVRSVDRDRQGYASVRFAQRLGGVTVLGGDIRAEVDRHGRLHTIHGQLIPFPRPFSLTARLAAVEAERRARATIGGGSAVERLPELVIARVGTMDHLAWSIRLRTAQPARWQILVDAQSGAILERRDILAAERDRLTYSANFTMELPGELKRREGEPPSGDPQIDAAHENAGRVYDYFRKQFRRDSLDGAGYPILSTVHYGQRYNNAFWDGSQVVYGDGDGAQFGPFPFALDIVAHEITHGVTEFTAGLIYYGQPGALNEAYSDIFGALVDSANWEIAEQIFTPGVDGDALRSLADPTRYNQPRRWEEFLDLPPAAEYDFGGVHFNSGVLNHIAWRIASDIGRDKLGQVFYRTLTMKLTSYSSFDDTRELTLQSCAELVGQHGITASDCLVVQRAFAAGGLGDYPAAPSTLDQPVFLPMAVAAAPQCGKNLLRNPGFEGGSSAWPNTGGVVARREPSHGGAWSARIRETGMLLQLVSLPGDGGRATLTFWLYREAGGDKSRLQIGVEDADTHIDLVTPMTFGPALGAGAWHKVQMNIAALRDRAAVRLVVRHASGKAAFLLDDLSLRISCEP